MDLIFKTNLIKLRDLCINEHKIFTASGILTFSSSAYLNNVSQGTWTLVKQVLPFLDV